MVDDVVGVGILTMEHRAHAIVEDLLRHAAERLECGSMTTQQRLRRSLCSTKRPHSMRLWPSTSENSQRYFSVDDIFDIVKAVVVAELLTATALFSFTRLDGIPRSTLFIHSLILAAALITARTMANVFEYEQKRAHSGPIKAKYAIVIASNYFSSAFIKWLETNDIEPKQVVAILDDCKEMIGRKISGVQILGRPSAIKQTVDEFAVHGVNVDEVIVSGGENHLAKPVLGELRRFCRQTDIELTFMPQLFQSTFRLSANLKVEPTVFQQAAHFQYLLFRGEANFGFRLRVALYRFAVTRFCMRQRFGGSRCWNSPALLAAEAGRRGPSLSDLQISNDADPVRPLWRVFTGKSSAVGDRTSAAQDRNG